MSDLAIVVLGGPNDAQGELFSFARERCDHALTEFAAHPAARVIVTGGWGAHFNTTPLPHWQYLRTYLESRGMPSAAFVEGVESTNTIEDARLSRPVVERYGFQHLILVTSGFHMARAQFLFGREFPHLTIRYSAAHTELPAAEMQARVDHEQRALARLRAG